MIKLNNKGSVLIVSYVVLFVLMTISVGIALLNINEVNAARRYYYGVKAFWLAEAGLSMYINDASFLMGKSRKSILEGDGRVLIMVDDSDQSKRLVTSTGIYQNVRKRLQLEYPSNLPESLKNSISVKGDFLITGKKSSLILNDKLRISGELINRSTFGNVIVEDNLDQVSSESVSLVYPDANGNGIKDEFNDFVEHNRAILKNYRDDEVVYITGDDTYFITPNFELEGKKIVYIEGHEDGAHVVIPFGSFLNEGEQLTIITTGKVTLNQGGTAARNSQLNIIAWEGYTETAVVPGVHQGIVYTHGEARFEDIYETAVTNGSVIALGGITVGEVWSSKIFNYQDMRIKGELPPGFEGLVGGTSSGYITKPIFWRELN
ncbi:hypothetical protein ACFL49_03085 [Candidatus Omnitrophota bacterium]